MYVHGLVGYRTDRELEVAFGIGEVVIGRT